jgi:hypothetical protein
MGKPSMTVIGLAMGLAGMATVVLAGGMPLEDDYVNKGSQPSVSVSDSDETDVDTFELHGTVVYKDVEGGFFAIDGDDGKTYDPINLPDSFKINGLKVNITAKLRNDMGSIHMVGDIIEIVKIDAE